MNKWREACLLATSRLNEALTCGRHAKRLAERPEIGIDNALTASLDEAMALAKKKSDRLERGEFHIAVVGSEKAGKSTFINAWLGCDLLPSDMQRCTFTTTHLHSETDNARQRLVIQPKTVQGMQELLSTLNKMKEGDSETANQAKEDLRSLGQHQATLKAVMQEGPQSISFTHISEIADTLRRYEASERGFERLALLEEAKSLPWGAVWDMFCMKNNVPVGEEFIPAILEYEKDVLSKRS